MSGGRGAGAWRKTDTRRLKARARAKHGAVERAPRAGASAR